MISETYHILEGLAAISMNPDSPPEERVFQLLKYRNHEIHDFYNSFDEGAHLDHFKSILAYPSVEDLDITKSDKEKLRTVLNQSAEGYKAFFLIAKEARRLIEQSRHKFTHGFLLALPDRVQRGGPGRTYPEECDDVLMTYTWEDNEVVLNGLLTGDRPHQAYLAVARNAAMVQQEIIFQLKEQMRNLGDPVFPERMMGNDELAEDDIVSDLSYSLVDVDAQVRARGDSTGIVQPQLDFFQHVDEFVENYAGVE